MTINEAMKTFRLPNPTTQEDIETNWETVITYGDKVLVAGYYFIGAGRPNYFGAVYEHLTDDMSAEGVIGLQAISEVEHEDNGHAIEWAMKYTSLR